MKISSNKSEFDSPNRIWNADPNTVISGEGPQRLSGAWKLILLGDGSPTRHLRLLTGHEVKVNLIRMEPELSITKDAPPEVKELKPPLLRRQVWLTCGEETLAWAESWWNLNEAKEHLKDKDQPIWKSLTEGRSELFREVDGLSLVTGKWLETNFQQKGPFWSRHYRFFRESKELTVIREVFSPSLEKWLGPATKNR